MRLWRDTGEAVEEALTEQRWVDKCRLSLIWPSLRGFDPRTGLPAPLELRDVAE